MEDSEKRKQMLKAMRMEAAAHTDDDSTGPETSMNTAQLFNSLAKTSTHQQESFETSRFDYYTDPMSAYSSFKKNKTPKQQYISSPSYHIRSPVQPQLSPSLPGSLGSEYEAHTTHGSFQAANYDGVVNRHNIPGGMAHLSPSHSSPDAWNNIFRPPPVNHLGPPHCVTSPFPCSQEMPYIGNRGFGGRASYNNTGPQSSHYGNTCRNSERGRGRGHGTNISFGRNGGRRHMEPRGEEFYCNSMAEDPWMHLQPVLWRGYADASSSNSTSQSLLPNSIAPKNSMTAKASQTPSNNQQSLTEYLAASLDEATCNTVTIHQYT